MVLYSTMCVAAEKRIVKYELAGDFVVVTQSLPKSNHYFYRLNLYYKTSQQDRLIKAKAVYKHQSADGKTFTLKWRYQSDGIYDVRSTLRQNVYLEIEKIRKRTWLCARLGGAYARRLLDGEDVGNEWYATLPGGYGALYGETGGASLTLEILLLPYRSLELRGGGVASFYYGRIRWNPDDKRVEGERKYGDIQMITFCGMAKFTYRLPNSGAGVFIAGLLGRRDETFKWENRDNTDKQKENDTIFGVELGLDLDNYFGLSGGWVRGEHDDGFLYVGLNFVIPIWTPSYSP